MRNRHASCLAVLHPPAPHSIARLRNLTSQTMTGLSSSAGPIPVTVAGYGGSANTFHLPFLLALPQHFQLFSIQQRPGPDKPDIKQRFPQIHVHPTPEEIFHPQPGGPPRLPEGGLVVITLINRLHFSTARLALENGCHVLCEKPLTLSSQEVKELQDLAQQKGLVCYTFQSTYNACNAVPLSLRLPLLSQQKQSRA